jgi:hypothetical protein
LSTIGYHLARPTSGTCLEYHQGVPGGLASAHGSTTWNTWKCDQMHQVVPAGICIRHLQGPSDEQPRYLKQVSVVPPTVVSVPPAGICSTTSRQRYMPEAGKYCSPARLVVELQVRYVSAEWACELPLSPASPGEGRGRRFAARWGSEVKLQKLTSLVEIAVVPATG